MQPRFVVVFATTADAMYMEQVCRENGVPGRLAPIPQQLEAGCGLCWRSALQEREQVETALQTYHLACQAVYELR